MSPLLRQGHRVPYATLAELWIDEVRPVTTDALFSTRHTLVIGVPGAFTPTCSEKHLPDFIQMADSLKRSGFHDIIVISPSDPFAVAAWATQVDPDGKLRFVSDGNLEFTRKAGLTSHEDRFFLGERSKRYLMIVRNAIVDRLSVEDSVLNVSCSRAQSLELDF
ncbi:MAG: peroxiredoxin [Caulobacter sp.]|nr:peroxiredoxin [Caulobacter sp.]